DTSKHYNVAQKWVVTALRYKPRQKRAYPGSARLIFRKTYPNLLRDLRGELLLPSKGITSIWILSSTVIDKVRLLAAEMSHAPTSGTVGAIRIHEGEFHLIVEHLNSLELHGKEP